jgi:hypothetical protein
LPRPVKIFLRSVCPQIKKGRYPIIMTVRQKKNALYCFLSRKKGINIRGKNLDNTPSPRQIEEKRYFSFKIKYTAAATQHMTNES